MTKSTLQTINKVSETVAFKWVTCVDLGKYLSVEILLTRECMSIIYSSMIPRHVMLSNIYTTVFRVKQANGGIDDL